MGTSVLMYSIISMLRNTDILYRNGWVAGWIVAGLQTIPPFILVPRLVLSLRELCAHNLQGGRGSHIDTAFGFGSRLEHDTVWSAIAFADPTENEDIERGDEQGDGVQMETIQEVRRTSSRA